MSVQTRYTDTYDRGFPGQIFNASSIDGNAVFSAYASTDVFVGRAVTYVSATEQQNYAETKHTCLRNACVHLLEQIATH
jgi:hypothetical protein